MSAQPRPKPVPMDDEVRQVVLTHLVGAVQFGTVTIRYQHGRPTHVERLEIIRLTSEEKPD